MNPLNNNNNLMGSGNYPPNNNNIPVNNDNVAPNNNNIPVNNDNVPPNNNNIPANNNYNPQNPIYQDEADYLETRKILREWGEANRTLVLAGYGVEKYVPTPNLANLPLPENDFNEEESVSAHSSLTEGDSSIEHDDE